MQARAADAARANLESHYVSLAQGWEEFSGRYAAQHASHAALLAELREALQQLAGTELHPALKAPGRSVLADLQPQQVRYCSLLLA